MSKNYAGIDYSGPGSTINRDPETGIRYGVISQHSIQPDVMSDIWSEARDLSYEQAKEELLSEIMADLAAETIEERIHLIADALVNLYDRGEALIAAREIAEAAGDGSPNEGDVWEVIEQDFNDSYDGDGHDWLWEKDGYTLANCLQSDVLVSKSPYFTYAQFCSPCVPGAGNLDRPQHNPESIAWDEDRTIDPSAPKENYIEMTGEESGWPRVFCLGHSFFENNKAPYPVFSVSTGKRVVIKTQFKSVAKWPDGVGINLGNTSNTSEDIHGDRASAQAVCDMLVRNGFGGDRQIFPVWVQVSEEKVEVEQ